MLRGWSRKVLRRKLMSSSQRLIRLLSEFSLFVPFLSDNISGSLPLFFLQTTKRASSRATLAPPRHLLSDDNSPRFTRRRLRVSLVFPLVGAGAGAGGAGYDDDDDDG